MVVPLKNFALYQQTYGNSILRMEIFRKKNQFCWIFFRELIHNMCWPENSFKLTKSSIFTWKTMTYFTFKVNRAVLWSCKFHCNPKIILGIVEFICFFTLSNSSWTHSVSTKLWIRYHLSQQIYFEVWNVSFESFCCSICSFSKLLNPPKEHHKQYF